MKKSLRTSNASCQDLSQREGIGPYIWKYRERGMEDGREREHSPEAVDAVDRLEVRGLDVLDTQPATQTHTRTHTLCNDSEDMNVCVHARECVCVGALSQFQRFRAEEGETDMMSRK